jgi:hypothetical protein
MIAVPCRCEAGRRGANENWFYIHGREEKFEQRLEVKVEAGSRSKDGRSQ